LPDRGFDTTEVAVAWRLPSERGHQIVFATEHGGAAPACDPLLLTGVVFGQLGAEPPAIADYHELTESAEVRAPISRSGMEPAAYDGLVLPGGHAPGMRQYLASTLLRQRSARSGN
jgi:putative intracellular protease/amidase